MLIYVQTVNTFNSLILYKGRGSGGPLNCIINIESFC